MKIRIDIEYQEFNSEYYSEVTLSHNKIEYLSSDTLEQLMIEISRSVLNYKELKDK
jgi:hypothetical protein